MLIRTGVIFTFTIICAVIAWIDIRKQKIYNETVAVLFVPAIVSFFVFPEISAMSRFLGAVSVSMFMLFISLLIPGAFGGGDIKLMVPIGLFLGTEKTLAAGVVAVFLGAIWSLILILANVFRRNDGAGPTQMRQIKFAFGPALCIGSVTAFILGDRIWGWLAEI